ncbi:MAG: deoxyribose-phosphate aldolase [Chloroflexi bacterium]|nr:deoxyribose-phosphate aldolase [Chloroflexota bacterium]
MSSTEHEWAGTLRSEAGRLLAGLGQAAAEAVPGSLTRQQLAAMIDHTVLKPEATPEMIEQACAEAREYGFASVCVNPCYVARSARLLEGAQSVVCSVVGFPLGANVSAVKAYEAERAIADGAREIDMVLPVGALKAGDYARVRDDIAAVVDRCHGQGALCKVIIEAALLTDEEKAIACLLIAEAGADFAKTSTGFGPGGATEHDVRLMRAAVGLEIGVKAAGGVRTYEQALGMIRAGANRIGASAGPQILAGIPA